jgi:hypothetical protein
MKNKIMISKDRKSVKLIFNNQNKNTKHSSSFEIEVLMEPSYQKMISKQHQSIQDAYKEATNWVIKNYPELLI